MADYKACKHFAEFKKKPGVKITGVYPQPLEMQCVIGGFQNA